jgi:hypothetical protein
MPAGLPYRRLVRGAIKSCLSIGFNDAIAANAEVYGVAPFEIDFSDSSDNFVQCYVDPDLIEIAPIMEFPAISIYTEDAEDGGQPFALGFGGAVSGCVDSYIRHRDGIESANTEDELDRIEDVVMTLFRAYTWPLVKDVSTVTYSRRAKSQRRHFIPLGDGWGSRISIQAQFSVSIN